MIHGRGPEPFTWGDLARVAVFAVAMVLMAVGAGVVVAAGIALVAH